MDPVQHPDEIDVHQGQDVVKRLLVEQVTGMVRWRESVIAMKTLGVERIAELGTGKALTGMIKRIDPEIACVPVGTPADIETFLKTL